MRPIHLLTAAAAGLFALASSGCIIVDADETDRPVPGPEEDGDDCCREVRVCETVCDDYGCYDECSTETRCPDNCTQQCAGDLDCPKSSVCIDGVCTGRNFDNTGTGGLCQTCETAYDCAEPDSRCVRLYFDRSPDGGPKVCATDCESAIDCPLGFECVDEPGTPEVCVPDEQLGSTDRVCPDDRPDGIECFSSRNCDAGESCIDNQCVAPDGECTEDSDCGAGARCRNATCVDDSEPECLSRTDCRSDEICVDGTCTPRNPEGPCVENEDCASDAVCVDGSCLSRCENRTDCNDSSEICRQGLCQPIECRFNSDCGTGELCVDAQCRPRCSDDAGCADGYVCAQPGGYCERDPAVECRSDAECLAGEVCRGGTCTALCNCNQQCDDGEICNPDATDAESTGVCEDPDAEPEQPTCETDCDCPSGEDCVDGTCQ